MKSNAWHPPSSRQASTKATIIQPTLQFLSTSSSQAQTTPASNIPRPFSKPYSRRLRPRRCAAKKRP
ncbi:hypothetical protein CSPX01_10314 [Colletotrichum filicis]|nr:hypothetical protein CSPX01_10314 [Colletotrichum filicis]